MTLSENMTAEVLEQAALEQLEMSLQDVLDSRIKPNGNDDQGWKDESD